VPNSFVGVGVVSIAYVPPVADHDLNAMKCLIRMTQYFPLRQWSLIPRTRFCRAVLKTIRMPNPDKFPISTFDHFPRCPRLHVKEAIAVLKIVDIVDHN
jgi:hypothetical protein